VKAKAFKVCRIKCKHCGDILEYENKSKEDNGPGSPLVCSCGRAGLDPSAVLYRVMAFPPGTMDDIEDLSEEWTDNPYPVGPGWWYLLDSEIPEMYEIDPGLTSLEIKEKYGFCQVDCWPSEAGWGRRDILADVASAIESQSATICENCGELTGVKPAPETPYCKRCYNLPTTERFAVREKTKEKYFRHSHIRHGEPGDRGEIKRASLKDFLKEE